MTKQQKTHIQSLFDKLDNVDLESLHFDDVEIEGVIFSYTKPVNGTQYLTKIVNGKPITAKVRGN